LEALHLLLRMGCFEKERPAQRASLELPDFSDFSSQNGRPDLGGGAPDGSSVLAGSTHWRTAEKRQVEHKTKTAAFS